MIDHALEANRRVAWARYYAMRADCKHLALWAAELAEWLEQTETDLPEPATQLIEAVRYGVTVPDQRRIERFVRFHARHVGAAPRLIGASS